MAYKIPLGQKMESVTVNRSNVADGIPSRALLLGEECIYGKQLAYDPKVRRSVEVDQEALIKYRFDRVFEYYYILIARLNTDMAGRVVSPDVTVEYIRLSDKQYNDLVTSMNEMKTFSSLLLNKVPKRGEKGEDFSYVDVKLSNYDDIPKAAFAKVEQMVNTPGFVDGIWSLVDAQTSITIEEYERRLAELEKDSNAAQAQVQPAVQAQVPRPVMPAPQSQAQLPRPQSQPSATPVRRIIQPQTTPQQVAPRTVQPVQQVTKQGGFVEIRPSAPASQPDDQFASLKESTIPAEDMAGVADFEGFSSGDFSGELE